MVFNEQVNMSEPIPVAQQNQVQGNHITTNNGSGNGNGRQPNPVVPTNAVVAPPVVPPTNAKPSKSSANAPSKSYVRKPINKK